MFTLVLAAAAAIAAPAGKPAPSAQAATAQQQLDALAKQLRSHGVSEDGVRKVLAGAQSGAAAAQALIPRIAMANQAVQKAGAAEPFSGATFEAALRRQQQAVLALAQLQGDRKIALFHSLSAPDQKVFARIAAQPAAVR